MWEESIILAPKTARFAFLSATIPNAREFADWVAKTHGSPCHVVYTGGCLAGGGGGGVREGPQGGSRGEREMSTAAQLWLAAANPASHQPATPA